jgi:glutamate dehydrogenase (NAD(P)+)
MNYFWTKDEVLSQLDTKITAAFHEALEAARRESLTLRDAAYFIAVARVVEACQYRGWV